MEDLTRIQAMICSIGNLPEIEPDAILQDAGFSSMSVLELLIQLEETFDITIPDEQFMAARSARALYDLVVLLKKEQGN